jgi:HSP20 family protein
MDQLAEGLSTFTTLAGPEAGSGSGAHSAGGGRLVFGYSIRMGEAGVSAEPFGNVAHQHHNRPAQPGAATRQPIVDIFEEVDGYLVVAELPGVQLQEITCTVLDTILHIRTAGPRPYAKEVVLPGPANPESLSVSCQHGILEVRLSHAGQAA